MKNIRNRVRTARVADVGGFCCRILNLSLLIQFATTHDKAAISTFCDSKCDWARIHSMQSVEMFANEGKEEKNVCCLFIFIAIQSLIYRWSHQFTSQFFNLSHRDLRLNCETFLSHHLQRRLIQELF